MIRRALLVLITVGASLLAFQTPAVAANFECPDGYLLT